MIRTISVAAIIAMTSAAAHSETADEKLCVMLSAQKVPSIAGLIVTGGRITGYPKPGMMNVEIDVRADGRDSTYGFMCAGSGMGSGPPVAVSTGLIR
jgi:hypothetical protein